MRPSREAVRSFLERARIRLSDHQLDQLWRFHEMLRARNAADDLTRLVGFESIVVKHYVDSMIVGDLFPLPPRLLDLGTGGGFPGLPLKIRYPELSLVLVEARERRTAFLADAVRELGLQDVEVVKLKANSRNLAIPVDAVITRAVERISATILRTSNCLGPGGLLLFPKGPSVEPEIEEALARHGRAIELLLDRPYSLPGTPYQRRLVVIRRRDDRPPGSERA
ncbi:MAG: 16S rRNA (guanine(527)-N(7))-methyltransferase RsmG [Gemmatimonadetes bacterium]|nr:16S rRNA (guanine(527)-N(7))-methyltransferase RsmG [Gemmatimonadota bacterium]